MESPETRYAKTADGVHIAYQVFGDGPVDLVYYHGFVGNIDFSWEVPGFASLYRGLGTFSRVLLFDGRGSGLSDRVGPTRSSRCSSRSSAASARTWPAAARGGKNQNGRGND